MWRYSRNSTGVGAGGPEALCFLSQPVMSAASVRMVTSAGQTRGPKGLRGTGKHRDAGAGAGATERVGNERAITQLLFRNAGRAPGQWVAQRSFKGQSECQNDEQSP